jgi:hypothetical protein
MKEEVLRLMKEQLKSIAEQVTYDNYRDMEGQVFRVFSIIESAETMIDTPVHPLAVPVKEEQEELPPLIKKILDEEPEPDEDVTMEQLLAEEEEDKKLDEQKAYRFERKIKGGILPEIEAYIPEKIIHDLDLCHGDLVSAEFLFKPNNGPARYDFELVEKADPPCSPENIIDIHMGVVSYEPRLGGLGITKTVNAPEIIYNDEVLILKISDEDADAMDLKEGDIVNAAFYENNPEYIRVRWKYNTGEIEDEQSSPRRSSSFYKNKDKEKEKVEQIFEDKTICVMGYEPGWPAFREEIEKRGGTLNTLTGREGFETIYGTIRKSDCLLLMIGHVGHTGTIFSVDFCKKNNIPQASLKTFGRTSFVETAANLLEN